ncbi:hypothetical protein METBIDRAFT_30314 [Metschnikowia bicuspidata var. bicuspidata NRRL YB-4993]|uniref:Uncharacterized protein n=1 Tax=Metschnikowia bicuspidata var. bicuspidata NRRL YB-4993 TaxID=869754 RepID=A0A1A0HIX7_9ASCO|nr:hypothetical protein METBIDRAFT_30314 [Metschnikowia bicuspidata var. bicuspidata NRRL YB-4993]OBA23956.1 hypothetical protein METBIDRAFT_30314 [Metschnikowia bicuspidata var. bicuspidata NRRL YB-4993]
MLHDKGEEVDLDYGLESLVKGEKPSKEQQLFNALPMEAKFERLNQLVQQSQIYSQVMLENMMKKALEKNVDQRKGSRKKTSTTSKLDVESDDLDDTKSLARRDDSGLTAPRASNFKNLSLTRNRAAQPKIVKKRKMTGDIDLNAELQIMGTLHTIRNKRNLESDQADQNHQQPIIISGCTMKDYQLDGLTWLVSLYENGLNGILADEMGLGKTLQCIALYGYLIEHGVKGPFLVVAPLSTVANWCNEFEKFAPGMSVLKYVGNKDTRAKIKFNLKNLKCIVVTSYEIIIRDFSKFARLSWEYLTVDEGHRLKNFQSVLIRSLKKLHVGNRLLLTGTPLQNNLKELWSLLNFILPDIFHDLDLFESWFDFEKLADSSAGEIEEKEKKKIYDKIQTEFVKQLHSILKPFLLRRVKEIVVKDLPPKKEYLIYADLTPMQNLFYRGVTDGTLFHTIVQIYLKEYLILNHSHIVHDEEGLSHVDEILRNRFRPIELKKRKRVIYNDEIQSDEFAESETDGDSNLNETHDLEKDKNSKFRFDDVRDVASCSDSMNNSKEYRNIEGSLHELLSEKLPEKLINGSLRVIEAYVKNLLLQNGVMQLRSICASHYTYYEPFPVECAGESSYDKKLADLLLENSGKLQLLEQITDKLLAKRHKILIFSQFTRVLDLIALHFQQKGISFSRLDGRMDQIDRTKQIELFSNGSSQLFLLSTRAGGLGLNLIQADTVILFDNDWNPQMDLQAIDRVHRIGQTRPVKVFRFVVRNSIEELLIMRSFSKRALEKLVIELGHFQLGKMAKKLASENVDMTAIKSFGSIFDLGRRLNVHGHGPKFLNSTHINSVVLGKAEKRGQFLESKELYELLDRSPQCYKRKPCDFTNMSSFETTNNMDK